MPVMSRLHSCMAMWVSSVQWQIKKSYVWKLYIMSWKVAVYSLFSLTPFMISEHRHDYMNIVYLMNGEHCSWKTLHG